MARIRRLGYTQHTAQYAHIIIKLYKVILEI